MAIYFTLSKTPAPPLTVIYDSDGKHRAIRYKQALISDGSYRSDQITITGTDAEGQPVNE